MAEKTAKKTNRINGGSSTNKLVHTAYQYSNDLVFPLILSLYVPDDAKVADVTYGKGIFWKNVDWSKYSLFASDLKREGLPEESAAIIDSRQLPYREGSLDAIVFDPPYMHTGGTTHNGHQNFEEYYANNTEQASMPTGQDLEVTATQEPKYHEAVLDLYFRSSKEGWRVLKEGGVLIVKCADEVCTNTQRLTHVEIINELRGYGFVAEDLFVVIRTNKPGVSRLKNKQFHARKNHSYFLVFRKPKLAAKRGIGSKDSMAHEVIVDFQI
jgi:hypothetical protein